MSSSFRRIHWGSEPVATSKLNEMAANDDFLYENMISGTYDVLGVFRDTGLSLRTGYVKARNTEEMGYYLASYYARPFLPGVRPVVTTSMATDGIFGLLHAVKALDGRAIPDHKGFYLQLWQLRDPGGPTKFTGEQFIAYISIAPNG